MVSRLIIYLIFFESSDDDIFLHREFLFISHKLLRAFIVKGIGLQFVYVKDQTVNITGFEDHRVMLQLLSCAVVVENSHRQYANE